MHADEDCVAFLEAAVSLENLVEILKSWPIRQVYLIYENDKLNALSDRAKKNNHNIEFANYEKLVELSIQHPPVYSWY